MKKTDQNSRKTKERNRMKRLLKDLGVDEHRIKMLDSVIDKTALLCVKLEDEAEKLEDATLIIEYDNGGGQKGTRQNPLYQAYESLWKAYMLGMTQIMASTGAVKIEEKAKDLKPQSVLALVRSKQKQA